MADESNTGWKVYRPEWYNDRVMETYISAPIVDKQNDMIPTETIKEAMDFYMRYGVYSYRHEEMPIGLPLAYKIKNGKVKIRVGIHNKIKMHDKVWKEIGDYGPSGASSIRGEATDQEKVCLSEDDCHNRINELSLWSISWVGDNPANPEAKVTDVAMAKSQSVQVTLDEVEAMVEKIIERKNGKYCLYAKKDRKLLGCHDTKEGAIRQERAIQARRYSKSDTLGEILTKIEKYKIPKGVKNEAITGRELRKKHGYGGGKVTKTINRHLIDKEYINYKMAMSIHKYYRRHETVDPQGKNFDNKKRPSKGFIMWKMMGGDAGHSWSKGLQDKVKQENPCEAGYEMIGTKFMGGRKVPNCVPTKKDMKTIKVKPPKGHHWMAYKDGPVLMVGDYAPHEGAVEEFEFEVIEEHDDSRLAKAEYQGRKVELNKPRRLSGDKKKFGVYVKNEKGNVVQVKFGDPNMDIKRDDPDKRRQFRARHNCDNPGPKHKARYWSCKMWSSKNVSDITKAECPCVIKTERLQKTNQYLDDIMRMIKFGTLIKQPKDDKKKPERRGSRMPGTWFNNCRINTRKLSSLTTEFTGRRKPIRDEAAFCSELWYNPGKFRQKYKNPDGSTGTTSGMKFRQAMGRSDFKPPKPKPSE